MVWLFWLFWFNRFVLVGFGFPSGADLVGLVITCWLPMVTNSQMGNLRAPIAGGFGHNTCSKMYLSTYVGYLSSQMCLASTMLTRTPVAPRDFELGKFLRLCTAPPYKIGDAGPPDLPSYNSPSCHCRIRQYCCWYSPWHLAKGRHRAKHSLSAPISKIRCYRRAPSLLMRSDYP